MDRSKLAHYIVRREADRFVFVPSPLFAAMMILSLGAGSVFMVFIYTIFSRNAVPPFTKLWFGPIVLLAAAMLLIMAMRAWRTRRTPLTVELSGRVSYGGQELCAPATVRNVRVAEARGGEVGDAEVALELATGELVFIPSQYFGRFRSHAQARPFAAKLAEIMAVQVTEPR